MLDRLPRNYAALDSETRRDLHLFVMSQNPATDLDTVATVIGEDPERWIEDFIAASIHSLISRLFALTVIEDAFCVGSSEPLIEEGLWVINVPAYDSLGPDELLKRVAERIRALKDSQNLVVQRLAVFGAFFDWIGRYVDPVLFRTLLELLVAHDFAKVEGDVLGRFFEIYAQRINRSRRRALGQYYTPLPIVRFMWALVRDYCHARGPGLDLTVLDPGMGSATFLTQGVAALESLGIRRPWERLAGFDIAPQVMGIAQVNFYMAVLARVTRSAALEIQDLRLYTTDSLDPRNGKYLKQVAPLFADLVHREFLRKTIEVSAAIKQEQHFWVVIGNPPYRNNSPLTLAQVADRFPRLLSSSASAARAQVRNIRDDYAWFFAAADHYLGDQGLICFITSDSYARKPSYRLFREEILKTYRIVKLVRLGQRMFQDVSDRISFVIILMERRPQPLTHFASLEPFEYVDLSTLAADIEQSHLATVQDPRLLLLDAIAQGKSTLPAPVQHVPSGHHRYVLLPIDEDVIGRVLRSSVPVYRKQGESLFKRKWPGLITAFDVLLKGDTAKDLVDKMGSFLGICRRYREDRVRREGAVKDWAKEYDVGDRSMDRLLFIAESAAAKRIEFDPKKIKRSVSGTIPNELRWYPPPQFRHWIYFEPRIEIPRNINPGKTQGWGWMQQWREPESHDIRPKLIFTTSTNPRAGYKAFVVDDEWYVKLHGGTSQQYHYTGLVDPTESGDVVGGAVENNLSDQGQVLRRLLATGDESGEAVLHYVAGVYNSSLAMEFLGEESGHDLKIRVPRGASTHLRRIVDTARQLRDLHRLLYDGPMDGNVSYASVANLAPRILLEQLGLSFREAGGGRFREELVADVPSGYRARLAGAINESQELLDGLIEELYA